MLSIYFFYRNFSSDQRIYNINVRKEFCIPIEGVPLLSISVVTNATQ